MVTPGSEMNDFSKLVNLSLEMNKLVNPSDKKKKIPITDIFIRSFESPQSFTVKEKGIKAWFSRGLDRLKSFFKEVTPYSLDKNLDYIEKLMSKIQFPKMEQLRPDQLRRIEDDFKGDARKVIDTFVSRLSTIVQNMNSGKKKIALEKRIDSIQNAATILKDNLKSNITEDMKWNLHNKRALDLVENIQNAKDIPTILRLKKEFDSLQSETYQIGYTGGLTDREISLDVVIEEALFESEILRKRDQLLQSLKSSIGSCKDLQTLANHINDFDNTKKAFPKMMREDIEKAIGSRYDDLLQKYVQSLHFDDLSESIRLAMKTVNTLPNSKNKQTQQQEILTESRRILSEQSKKIYASFKKEGFPHQAFTKTFGPIIQTLSHQLDEANYSILPQEKRNQSEHMKSAFNLYEFSPEKNAIVSTPLFDKISGAKIFEQLLLHKEQFSDLKKTALARGHGLPANEIERASILYNSQFESAMLTKVDQLLKKMSAGIDKTQNVEELNKHKDEFERNKALLLKVFPKTHKHEKIERQIQTKYDEFLSQLSQSYLREIHSIQKDIIDLKEDWVETTPKDIDTISSYAKEFKEKITVFEKKLSEINEKFAEEGFTEDDILKTLGKSLTQVSKLIEETSLLIFPKKP